MIKPCIGITGATGFIGSALINYFWNKGYHVVRFSRHAKNMNGTGDDRFFSLETPPTNALLQGIDILIHCAYDHASNPQKSDINYTGSIALFEASKRAGTKKIIFLSSRAAYPGTPSTYGKSKLATEKALSAVNDVILKCGLVIGQGGLFKKMVDFALKKRVIPLINNGTQPLQLVRIEEIVQAIEKCIESDLDGVFNLASNEPITYKKFFQLISMISGKKIYFIYVPDLILKMSLSISNTLGIPFPVNRSNLDGLNSMKFISTKEDLEKLGIVPMSPIQSLTAFINEGRVF